MGTAVLPWQGWWEDSETRHMGRLSRWKSARPRQPYCCPHLPLFQAGAEGLGRGPAFGSVHQTQLSSWSCPCWGDWCHSERQELPSFFPAHLDELIHQLPVVRGDSSLEPINFSNCPRLRDRGLGTCRYEASSCLVICSAEEVLQFLVVWKFSILISYQHQQNKWAVNICLHLTA